MTYGKVFLERSPVVEIPSVDKKRLLIENQQVTAKERVRQQRGKKPLSCFESKTAVYGYHRRKVRKGFFLVVCFSLLLFLSLLPFFIHIRSYVWERRSAIPAENDLLYNLFLIEGMGHKENGGTAPGRVVSIPSLKLRSYRVQEGDSLFGLARRFDVSVDSIITVNDLKNAYYLQIGRELKIPNMSGIFYTVSDGDTLSGISEKYGVSVNRIADVNDLSSSVIHKGQRFFLPGARLSDWERAVAIGSIFRRPVAGRLTSKMGFRKDPFTGRSAYHAGIDIANRLGTPVYAAQYGRVVFCGYRGNYGKTVVIVHPQGYSTLYAHLEKILVKRGQAVRQGQKIGLMGSSGRSTGTHLHFEVHQNKKLIDPLKVVRLK